MRRLIAIRKRYPVFGRGTIEFLHPTNRRVLAYLRCDEGQTILVVNNLSRFVQPVELDLRAVRRPASRSSCSARQPSPESAEAPYFLSLGPHTFYWFRSGARATSG